MPNMLEAFSMDLKHEDMDKLHIVFPECFSECKIDMGRRLSLCGEYASNDYETALSGRGRRVPEAGTKAFTRPLRLRP